MRNIHDEMCGLISQEYEFIFNLPRHRRSGETAVKAPMGVSKKGPFFRVPFVAKLVRIQKILSIPPDSESKIVLGEILLWRSDTFFSGCQKFLSFFKNIKKFYFG